MKYPYRKFSALSCTLLFALAACDSGPARPAPTEMTPIKAAQGEIHVSSLAAPASRPKVKLRKNKDGTYSWEIAGDDVDAILDADAKLRDGAGKSGNKKAH